MALPVLIGLPLLGAFFTKAFEFFLDLFLKRYTFRLAMGFAHIALMVALFLGFAAVIATTLEALTFTLPDVASKVIAHFFPSVMPLVLSGFATVHLAEFVLDIKTSFARTKYSYMSGK